MTFDDEFLRPAPSAVGSPVGLLLPAIVFEVLGIVGLLIDPVRIWTIVGYVSCSIGAIGAVAGFRLIDGRRRSQSSYRLVRAAERAAAVLLVAAWVIASCDAWRLATALSR